MAGFRGKYRNRRDANEPSVVETLEKFGFSVERLDTPADLLVGHGGRTWLVEVKQPKGKLNEKQSEFAQQWKGHFAVIRSAEEAAEWARSVKDEADTWQRLSDVVARLKDKCEAEISNGNSETAETYHNALIEAENIERGRNG